jgi:hypothetical protein
MGSSNIFPVASYAWDHATELDAGDDFQSTLASPAPAHMVKRLRGEAGVNTGTQVIFGLPTPKYKASNRDGLSDIDSVDDDDDDDEDFVTGEDFGIEGVGTTAVNEEGTCSHCQAQQRRVVAMRNDFGAMVPLLDLDAPFRFPATHITKRPKLSSMRLLASFDAHLGGLVVSSYSENFAIEFEYSMDGNPFEDLRGKPIKVLEGKATNIRGNIMLGFETAAKHNARAADVINIYTSRGNARQCYMEWIPLSPNRSSMDDTQAGFPERQYLVLVSHMQIRGYADSEDKFRLRFTGEQVLPLTTTSRRRADTSKTNRRCVYKTKHNNASTASSSSASAGQGGPSDGVPWGLPAWKDRLSSEEEIDPQENDEVEEIRDIVQTATLAASLLRFMGNWEIGQPSGPFLLMPPSNSSERDVPGDQIWPPVDEIGDQNSSSLEKADKKPFLRSSRSSAK